MLIKNRKKMKRVLVPFLCLIICISVFYSCDKTESKPIEEVIVGRWVFDQYTTSFDSKNNVELQRLLDSVVLYYSNKKISDDFVKVVEFSSDKIVKLYDNNSSIPSEPSTEEPADESGIARLSLKNDSGTTGQYEYGTYSIIGGDSLVISKYDANAAGFPITNARVWTNNSNWLTISAKVSDYLDLEAIYKRINLSTDRQTKLANGHINLLYKRYAEL
jgi:hypothetical protein